MFDDYIANYCYWVQVQGMGHQPVVTGPTHLRLTKWANYMSSSIERCSALKGRVVTVFIRQHLLEGRLCTQRPRPSFHCIHHQRRSHQPPLLYNRHKFGLHARSV